MYEPDFTSVTELQLARAEARGRYGSFRPKASIAMLRKW
jgi:hypothetical protein